jgi:Prenyltransferase and squalene oxidase repeat
MIEQVTALLLDSRNPDGGWGSAKGKRSNTEATSLAVLALKSLEHESHVRGAISWLAHHQNADGSWPLNDASKQSSWTTPLAMLAMLPFPDQMEHALSAAKWILTQEGRKPGWLASVWVRLSQSNKTVELDPFLSGWSWTNGAFSWVEPTSYCLIALKKVKSMLGGTNAEERIRQGEMLIYDRMCDDGGWNYGNSKVLGDSLWPYPDITAVALIALQDHAASRANRLSLRALDMMMREVVSGLALSWGIICLSIYNQDTRESQKLLAKSFEKTRFLGETKTLALAILALANGGGVFESQRK